MPIVYQATNTVNGKRYIGASKRSLEKRKATHLYAAFHPTKERQCARFYNALRKYGRDSFLWTVLKTLDTPQKAFACEISLIAEFAPEYNMTRGGEGVLPPISLNTKKVICLDDGNVFISIRDAASHYHVDPSALCACCKPTNKRHHILHGLHFRYYDESLLSKDARDRLIFEIDMEKNKRKRGNAKTRNILIGDKFFNGRSAVIAIKNSKAVRCITTGKTFQSGSAAAAFYGISVNAIYKVCLGQRPKAAGLSFEYIDKAHLKPRTARPVRCVTTGETFPSITAAARFYDLSACAIQHVCAKLNKHRKTAGGLVFEYADNPQQEAA